jgi:hypothetical protein
LTSLLIAIALVVALLLAWWWLRTRVASQRADNHHPADDLDTLAAWPPQATRVLTSVERDAYERLRSALPAHMILAQVPLARFIKVPTRNSYAEWLRRVGQLCADLVICDRYSQVVAVVEIHSGTEQVSPRVLKRQQRLARVLTAADIPVHVWLDNTLPSVEAAREAIAPTPPAPESAPGVPSPVTRTAPQRPRAEPAPDAFADVERDMAPDEVAGLREAPPETWYDDFDSGPAPLAPDRSKGVSPR